ncbi:MAG: sugar phosphate nucleotidyltransferase [Thermoanaerobaculum sp.]
MPANAARSMELSGMLLAAGLGERMEPLSSLIPKPALPVLGDPLLAASLRSLHAAGCTRVVVNLHRHPEQVAAAVQQVARGLSVVFSWEPELLGPAGGLSAARPALGEGPVLVSNADCWSRLALEPLLAFGRPDRAVLALLPHPHRQQWGAVHLDAQGRVVAFSRAGENLDEPGYLFTGFQLLGRETLSFLPPPPAPMPAFWQPLMAEGRLFGVVVRGAFREAGDPAAYWQLVMEALAGTSFVHPLATVSPSAHIKHTMVAAGARVSGHARLSRCALLPGTEVGSGACLSDCVVAGSVPAGAFWERALVMPEAVYALNARSVPAPKAHAERSR